MRISDWSSDVCSSDLGPGERTGESGGDGRGASLRPAEAARALCCHRVRPGSTKEGFRRHGPSGSSRGYHPPSARIRARGNPGMRQLLIFAREQLKPSKSRDTLDKIMVERELMTSRPEMLASDTESHSDAAAT